MQEIIISKVTDSTATVLPGGSKLFTGYECAFRVRAQEFARDTASAASLELVDSAGAVAASCPLVPDPLRRPVRTGSLTVVAAARLRVTLSGSVVMDIPMDTVPGTSSGSSPSSGGRWTVVDMGLVTNGRVPVGDLQQITLSASDVAMPLDVVTGEGFFEAYVIVTGTLGRFPFTGVTVNGAEPVWTRMDSLQLRESSWTLHVVKVAGSYRAELSASRYAGTELDPDGSAVTSAEVNR